MCWVTHPRSNRQHRYSLVKKGATEKIPLLNFIEANVFPHTICTESGQQYLLIFYFFICDSDGFPHITEVQGMLRGKNGGSPRKSADDLATLRWRAVTLCHRRKRNPGGSLDSTILINVEKQASGEPLCLLQLHSNVGVQYILCLSCWIILREMVRESQSRIVNNHWSHVFEK